jgi:osmoprotectant transport system permease protein
MMEFLASQREALLARTIEHVTLTGITIIMAILVGVVLAVLAYRHRALRTPLLAAVGMLQTIPGIALLVMAMSLFGHIGAAPALFALILYALLPIVQNTLVGLNVLSPALGEVARGIGLTPAQHLRYVRLPLAVPIIMAGVRIAAVQTVGLATLAAFVGAGGLGQFINRGLFLSDTRLILLGAIPAALLALVIHGLLSLITFAFTPHHAEGKRRMAMVAAALIIGCCAVAMGTYTLAQRATGEQAQVTVGSKNFTEQLIVAEMVAQTIEQQSGLTVARRFGLGGSSVMHQALRDGTIDIAVEYTGTALTSVLRLPVPAASNAVFPLVRDAYRKQFGITWFTPLGFDNSYRLAIRGDDARLSTVTTTSALVPHAAFLRAAFDFEFAERDDGYKGLKKTYGLNFANVVDMHPDLLYPALQNNAVDVISAYTTDGRINTYGFRVLADDRHFFPPYEAAIVARNQVLLAHPALTPILENLSQTLDDATMRAMNAKVDSKVITVEQAASELLQQALKK